MTGEQFKEKFKGISEEIKKSLNWEINHTCPNCGHKSREDAFKAMEITASLSDWDCPYCIMEQKGVHQGADVSSLIVPDFRGLVETFQLHFLEGYLQVLLASQDREIYLYFEDDKNEPTKPLPVFWDDLSSAVVKVYTALEVYLSYQIRRKLQEREVVEDIIDLILKVKRPQVRDYFEMWEKLEIWNSLRERINEEEFNELKKIKEEFFSCQSIRNDIVHDGKQASPKEFLKVFASVGRFIAGSHKHL